MSANSSVISASDKSDSTNCTPTTYGDATRTAAAIAALVTSEINIRNQITSTIAKAKKRSMIICTIPNPGLGCTSQIVLSESFSSVKTPVAAKIIVAMPSQVAIGVAARGWAL